MSTTTFSVRLSITLLLLCGVFGGSGCQGPDSKPDARGTSHRTFTQGSQWITAADERRVHYSAHGTGDKTLALVHGWACDHRVWWKNVSQLAQHYRVLAIDLPGHGQSDEPKQQYSMKLLADGIDAVLRAEGVESVTLVAHSNGVPTVWQYYRQFPQKVERMVLLDGALKNMLPTGAAQQFSELFRQGDYQATVHRFVSGMPAPNLDPVDRARLVTIATEQPQHAVIGGFEATTAKETWREDRINVPVLMINVAQDAWNAAYRRHVHNLVPDLEYRELTGVGHFLMVEKPGELTEWIRTFVGD